MGWQQIAVWITVAAVAAAAVRWVVRRLRGRNENPCSGCGESGCPKRKSKIKN